jgi:hypothetical protein
MNPRLLPEPDSWAATKTSRQTTDHCRDGSIRVTNALRPPAEPGHHCPVVAVGHLSASEPSTVHLAARRLGPHIRCHFLPQPNCQRAPEHGPYQKTLLAVRSTGVGFADTHRPENPPPVELHPGNPGRLNITLRPSTVKGQMSPFRNSLAYCHPLLRLGSSLKRT